MMNNLLNLFIVVCACMALAFAADQHYKTTRYVACVAHHEPKDCE